MMTYYTRRQQTQPITQYSRGPPRSLPQYHADKQPHKSHRDADPRDVYDSQQWLNDARAIRREPGQFRSADLNSAFSGWGWTPPRAVRLPGCQRLVHIVPTPAWTASAVCADSLPLSLVPTLAQCVDAGAQQFRRYSGGHVCLQTLLLSIARQALAVSDSITGL